MGFCDHHSLRMLNQILLFLLFSSPNVHSAFPWELLPVGKQLNDAWNFSKLCDITVWTAEKFEKSDPSPKPTQPVLWAPKITNHWNFGVGVSFLTLISTAGAESKGALSPTLKFPWSQAFVPQLPNQNSTQQKCENIFSVFISTSSRSQGKQNDEISAEWKTEY